MRLMVSTALILLAGCARHGPATESRLFGVASLAGTTCSSPDSSWSPDSSRVPYENLDRYDQCYYSQILAVLGEGALRDAVGPDTTYRLLVEPTFGRASLVPLDQGPSGVLLTVAQSIGSGGLEPKGVAFRRTEPLPLDDWDRLVGMVSVPDFWQEPADAYWVNHGTQFVLEERAGVRTRVLSMCCPQPTGPWAKQRLVIDLLMEIAELPH